MDLIISAGKSASGTTSTMIAEKFQEENEEVEEEEEEEETEEEDDEESGEPKLKIAKVTVWNITNLPVLLWFLYSVLCTQLPSIYT